MPDNSELRSKIDFLQKEIRRLKIENERLAKKAGDASAIYQIAETARSESETLFKAVFENSRDAIGVSIRGIHVFANPAYYKLFGLRPDTELRGLPILQLIAPVSRENIKEYVRARAQGEPLPFLYRTRGLRTDGTEFDMEVNVSTFRENNQDHTLVILRDISDRIRAEEALKKSENMLHAVIDAEPECVKLIDAGANVIMMNRAGLEMLQADSADQVEGKAVCPFIAREYRESFVELTHRVLKGKPGILVFQMTGLKGRTLWLETNAVPFKDQNDEIVAVLAITRDITERKKAEEALRESEERLRDLAESLPLTIFEMDRQGSITFVNRAGLELFGYSRDDIKAGVNVTRLIAPEDSARALDEVSMRVRGERSGHNEYTGVRKDGTTFPFDVISGPIVRNSAVVRIRGIITDISERKKAEEQALRVQKLESIGKLAGGIAHDFNNLLQGIFGYVSLAKMRVHKPKNCLFALDQAEKALQLSVKLTNQLLTFSKGGKPVKKVIELGRLIEDSAELALSGSRCRHRLTSDQDLWLVEADDGQISQVIHNVVLNAQQAMPDGGCIEIAARNVEILRNGLPHTLSKGKHVEIKVTDTGIGIPEKYITKIFDPYFTTKEKGNGLGLATAYSIIQNHNGFIDVKSVVGTKTVFSVYLPAIEAGNNAGSLRQLMPEKTAPPGKILLMDDDQVIREVTGILIEGLGHEVVFAVDGEEAIKKYIWAMQSGRPYSAVILDLTIRSGMGGVETIMQLRRIDPSVKAIVSSGYSDEGAVSDYRDKGFKAFLKKPYTDDELRAALNTVLSERE